MLSVSLCPKVITLSGFHCIFFTDYTTVSRNEISTLPKRTIGTRQWIFFAKEKVDIACVPMSAMSNLTKTNLKSVINLNSDNWFKLN